MADPIDDQTVPTEEMAKELSKILGCTGAHKIDDGKWGPCLPVSTLITRSRTAPRLTVSGLPAVRLARRCSSLSRVLLSNTPLTTSRL